MFFFIGGVQPRTITLARVDRVCTVCAHPEICQKRVDHYVSLFFIPLFPVKRGTPFWICENCNTEYDDFGAPLTAQRLAEKMVCPHCRRPISADYTYCPYCGKIL